MSKNSLFGLLAAMVFCSAVSVQGQGNRAAQSLPEGNGKTIVETACTTCHAVTMITSAGHTPEDWKLLMERMVAAGAEVPQKTLCLMFTCGESCPGQPPPKRLPRECRWFGEGRSGDRGG